MELTAAALAQVVETALREDVGAGDLTTEGVIAPDARCSAELLLEEAGVLCGLNAARAVFQVLAPAGTRIDRPPAAVARIEARARAVLTGERTALNLLGRLCGIATLTARYVERVEGTGARILDTRKTTPGLRALERYAVRCGGGSNHRDGLYDAILLKENHLRLAGGISAALTALGERNGTPVEVEAE